MRWFKFLPGSHPENLMNYTHINLDHFYLIRISTVEDTKWVVEGMGHMGPITLAISDSEEQAKAILDKIIISHDTIYAEPTR